VRWQKGDNAFRITVDAPEGTSGTVAIPTLGKAQAIYLDGNPTPVWTADSDDIPDHVNFTGITGAHTWAWSN
jgi:hypothetical protein